MTAKPRIRILSGHAFWPGASATHGFLRRTEGSLAVFSLFVFVAMLLVSGLAIDLMRYENERMRMQGVADRAALAATSLRENSSGATPEQILRAYFAAEGLEPQLGNQFFVDDSVDSNRVVTVAPSATIPSLFMQLIGIDSFAVTTTSRAAEALGGATRLELVMVLDVSGSMAGQQKIVEMRDAAASLVNTLLGDAEGDEVAISIVPYDAWALPPAGFLNQFTDISGSGACADFEDWDAVTNSIDTTITRSNCNTQSWRTVRPYLNDSSIAEGYISQLRASSTTSIDVGLRFGALFFDPTIRPAITAMIANGEIDPVFAGRPFDWAEPGVVRALILLTDGQNCCGERYTTSEQDDNAISICDGLKGQNVLIYSIAYQAPASGAALMQDCASSPSHYFNTSTDEIANVFRDIGSSIQTLSLRLTL